MDQIVADASVIVKLFVKEEYTGDALNMMNLYVSGAFTIAAPSLLFYEVLNSVRYSKSKRFTLQEINLVANALLNFNFNIVQPEHDLLEEAIRLSTKYDISIYDSVYIALALSRGATLYTADQKLIRKVKLPLLKHIKEFK